MINLRSPSRGFSSFILFLMLFTIAGFFFYFSCFHVLCRREFPLTPLYLTIIYKLLTLFFFFFFFFAGVFLLCWVPFFVFNNVEAWNKLYQFWEKEFGAEPFFVTTWLGYMNSFLNPCIYTIFNSEFRKAFKKLLSGPCV